MSSLQPATKYEFAVLASSVKQNSTWSMMVWNITHEAGGCCCCTSSFLLLIVCGGFYVVVVVVMWCCCNCFCCRSTMVSNDVEHFVVVVTLYG